MTDLIAETIWEEITEGDYSLGNFVDKFNDKIQPLTFQYCHKDCLCGKCA